LGKRNVVSRMGDVPSMTNLADLCRECEVSQKVRELEEENRALKEALTWVCNRLELAGSARLKGMRRRKRNEQRRYNHSANVCNRVQLFGIRNLD
jgi:hypothetical protein